MFKNQVMPDSYKMDEIDQLYGFDQEKNIFTYARKEAITQDNAINNNNTAKFITAYYANNSASEIRKMPLWT